MTYRRCISLKLPCTIEQIGLFEHLLNCEVSNDNTLSKLSPDKQPQFKAGKALQYPQQIAILAMIVLKVNFKNF